VLTSGAADGDVLEVLSFGTFQTGDFVPTSGGTFNGSVTVPSLTSTNAITASGGVYLGGTGSDNLLEDYETGTWTPFFTNMGTGTYSHQVGSYVKIGNLVTIQCHLDIATIGSASGVVVVGGLPFASKNSSALYGLSSSVHGTGWAVQRTSLNILLGPNKTTTNQVYYGMALGSPVAVSHADIGGGNLLFNMSYRTD